MVAAAGRVGVASGKTLGVAVAALESGSSPEHETVAITNANTARSLKRFIVSMIRSTPGEDPELRNTRLLCGYPFKNPVTSPANSSGFSIIGACAVSFITSSFEPGIRRWNSAA